MGRGSRDEVSESEGDCEEDESNGEGTRTRRGWVSIVMVVRSRNPVEGGMICEECD